MSEVAWAVHFPAIQELHVGHLGSYWTAVKKQFPILEQHQPAPYRQPEAFEPAAQHFFSVSITPMSPLPRCWFISAERDLVIQVQSDRLVLNWRRIAPDAQYPRFDFMRERFNQVFEGWGSFLRAQGLPVPHRFNGEITYVNTVTPGTVWQTHGDAHRIFRQIGALDSEADQALRQEELRFEQRYVFPNPKGQDTGRLYVGVEPSFTLPEGQPVFNLTLTARGGESGSTDDLLDFYAAGRSHIVRTFDAMTTPEMHAVWGKA